jgi:hypothetical protein
LIGYGERVDFVGARLRLVPSADSVNGPGFSKGSAEPGAVQSHT